VFRTRGRCNKVVFFHVLRLFHHIEGGLPSERKYCSARFEERRLTRNLEGKETEPKLPKKGWKAATCCGEWKDRKHWGCLSLSRKEREKGGIGKESETIASR